MLVLTRKEHERIYIGNNITITIARLEGNRVKVGIDAPADVVVRRAELVDQWGTTPGDSHLPGAHNTAVGA